MEFYTSGTAQILANAGLDFVIYDMEHGRCDINQLSQLAVAGRGAGLTVIARPPDLSAAPLGRLLDVGVHGIMVPRVETAEQAREIVAAVKYAPEGRRGVAVGIAHDNYRATGPGYFAQANQETVIIAILETATAFENLDAILATPGLDVGWMGHYDLTVSMGIPAQFDHPRFREAWQALADGCRRHGIAAGYMPTSPEQFEDAMITGYNVLGLGSDLSTYIQGVDAFAQLAGLEPRQR
jgi:2-dehydro-3-deoxyglucarate aldolase/4-hydroxy-2-oxoheptanedioate aldolase